MDRKGSNDAADSHFHLNGVDALTGGPLRDAQSMERVVALAEAEFKGTARSDREELKALSDLKRTPNYGLDVDKLNDPGVARWGVILAAGEDPAIRQALQPLIDLRASQMGSEPKWFEVDPETTALQFLRDNGVERGLGAVKSVPYYLLIASDPGKISFRFQMELNTEYATGRLDFDSSDGYGAYAEQLVKYETGQAVSNAREAVFWAPERSVDPSTSKSAPLLIQPLYDQLDPQLEFAKRLFRGGQDLPDSKPATKEGLRSILSGPRRPALLFTASHGLGYKEPYPGQTEQQGALMCQEYVWNSKIDSSQWYGANDLIEDGGDLHGLVHFAFACFGAGTPQHDDYGQPDAPAAMIANQPFVAALPRAMLCHGALAFVGHVEMAWGYSFMADQPNGLTPLEAFRRGLHRILAGDPIAHALRDQYDRGVHLSSSLLEQIAFQHRKAPVSPATLVRMWIERNDARAYVLIGDPAARLRVDALLSRDSGPADAVVAASAPPATAAADAGAAHASTPAAPEPGTLSSLPRVAMPKTTPDPTTPAAPQPDGQAPAGGPGSGTVTDDRDTSYLPPPVTGRDGAVDRDLLVAWKDHMKEGFKQNNKMFRRVLSAFMLPYWFTVVMYVALFLFGLGAFGLAAVLAAQQQFDFAAVFGGLSAVTFLAFFISRPLKALEQNVILITWLGIVYNTYWSQLMNATNQETIQKDLDAITNSALNDLRALLAAQGKLSSQRPDPPSSPLPPGAMPQ